MPALFSGIFLLRSTTPMTLPYLPRRYYWYLAAVVGVHILLSFTVQTPFTYNDELQYWLMAHQLSLGQLKLSWAGAPFNYPSVLYPLVLAPFSRFAPFVMYDATKILNGLLMSSVVIPTYLLARRIGATVEAASWAAMLSAMVPSMVFAADVLVEPLYYPLFTWAIYGIVRVFDATVRPRFWECLVWGLLMGALFLVKPQGLLVPLLFVGAVFWRLVIIGRHGSTVLDWLYRCGAVTVGILIGLGLRLLYLAISGFGILPLSAQNYLGFYYNQNPALGGGSLSGIGAILVAYVALLMLAVGVLPFLSLFSRRTLHLVKTEPTMSLTWALCIAASLILVAIFARNTLLYNLEQLRQANPTSYLRAQERYLFPVSGVVFALWARSGFARIRGSWLSIIATGTLVFFGFVLLKPYVTISVLSDSPTLTGLLFMAATPWPRLLTWGAVLLASVTVGVAEAASPTVRRALILLLLCGLSLGAYLGDWYINRGYAAYVSSAQVVSRAVPQDATLLFDASLPPDLYFTIEFWHPSHWRLIPTSNLASQLTQPMSSSAFVVTPRSQILAGSLVASDSRVAVVAYHSNTLDPTILVDGRYPDGWLAPQSTITVLPARTGSTETLQLSLDASYVPEGVGALILHLVASNGWKDALTIKPGAKSVVTIPLGFGTKPTPYTISIQGRAWIPNDYLHNGDTRLVVVRLISAKVY